MGERLRRTPACLLGKTDRLWLFSNRRLGVERLIRPASRMAVFHPSQATAVSSASPAEVLVAHLEFQPPCLCQRGIRRLLSLCHPASHLVTGGQTQRCRRLLRVQCCLFGRLVLLLSESEVSRKISGRTIFAVEVFVAVLFPLFFLACRLVASKTDQIHSYCLLRSSELERCISFLLVLKALAAAARLHRWRHIPRCQP